MIGGDDIGRAVVESIGASPAIVLKNHGVFTVGLSPLAAIKAAIMAEDIARTVWVARQLGQPQELAAADVAKLHARYTSVYGQ